MSFLLVVKVLKAFQSLLEAFWSLLKAFAMRFVTLDSFFLHETFHAKLWNKFQSWASKLTTKLSQKSFKKLFYKSFQSFLATFFVETVKSFPLSKLWKASYFFPINFCCIFNLKAFSMQKFMRAFEKIQLFCKLSKALHNCRHFIASFSLILIFLHNFSQPFSSSFEF